MVAVLFIQFFLFVASFSLRAIGDFLTTIMPETPLAAFVIPGALVSAYVAGGGLEVLARTSEVIAPVYIIALFALLALLIPEMDLSELLPLFQHGAGQIIMGSLLPASWFGVCIIMAVFGAEYVPVFNYLIYVLARQISLADILERPEILWVTVWLFAGFITISSLHYACPGHGPALGTAELPAAGAPPGHGDCLFLPHDSS